MPPSTPHPTAISDATAARVKIGPTLPRKAPATSIYGIITEGWTYTIQASTSLEDFGDDFAHLYLDAIATNHNASGRGYETFGNGTAETLTADQPGVDKSVEWYRPLPPPA